MDAPTLLQLTRVVRGLASPARPAAGGAELDGDIEPGLELVMELVLGYEDRRRSRQRVRLRDGREAALRLPRGTILREGDRVTSDDGQATVLVRAAEEPLSVARTNDPHLLARAAYHLGNRHVPLELRPGRLSYQHDHVLDGLVSELGLAVTCEASPFEPEAGGYRHHGVDAAGPHRHDGHGHEHGPDDEHPHDHGHEHSHGHGHDHGHGHTDATRPTAEHDGLHRPAPAAATVGGAPGKRT